MPLYSLKLWCSGWQGFSACAKAINILSGNGDAALDSIAIEFEQGYDCGFAHRKMRTGMELHTKAHYDKDEKEAVCLFLTGLGLHLF